MPAVLLAYAKEVRDDGSIVEVVIWQVSERVVPSAHQFKYRLYYGSAGDRRIAYDNERGKGDHRHIGETEERYEFSSIKQLLEDFRRDVENWRPS